MGEKTFSKRIAKTEIDKARKGLASARTETDKRYFRGLLEIALDNYDMDSYSTKAKGGAVMKARGGTFKGTF
jgi:hypothetical protein